MFAVNVGSVYDQLLLSSLTQTHLKVDCCVLENSSTTRVPADYQRGLTDSGSSTQRTAVLQNSEPVYRQQLQPACPALASQRTSAAAESTQQNRFDR